MSEKEKGNWQETRSKLEKAGKIAALAGTLAVVAGCAREGEPAPTVEGVDETEPKVSEIQEAESTEQGEIRVTQEAFTGSVIKETEDLKLEITPTLDLGVEKTQAIVTKAKEKGLEVEEVSYLSFYKVDETGNRELVVILSAPSKEKEGESDFYYVSGRKGNKYVPVEASSEVELVELREYTETEGGETTILGFETGTDEAIPVIEMTKSGSFYTDPYTRVVTRMSEELSSEVLAMLSSMPEGAEELIDRLGEGVEVIGSNLVYNNEVVGELDNERQVSFQVGEETVTISTEDLEVKDGVLVSINRERTEEMGVDWVEQVWSISGERIAVPEPQILLPETYEETLTVKEQVLDYFMPMLLAAEKKWLDENVLEEGRNLGFLTLPFPEGVRGLPYAERRFMLESGNNYDKVVLSSWIRVQMDNGKIIDVVGVPFKTVGYDFGSYINESIVWHFAYDDGAVMNWSSGDKDRYKSKNVFESLREDAHRFLTVRMFIDGRKVEGWEEYDWFEDSTRKLIGKFGFEEVDSLMDRIELNIAGYNDIKGRQMVYTFEQKNPQVPEGFMEKMEEQLIPALAVYGDG